MTEILKNQLYRYRILLLLIYSPTVIGLLALTFQREVHLNLLTQDLVAIADLPVYWGLLSTIGVILWMATAILCSFIALTIAAFTISPKWVVFFIYGTIMSLLLGLDDLFLLHERILPYHGIHEYSLYVIHAALAVGLILIFWEQLQRSAWIILIIAGIFLGGSLSIDLLYKPILATYHFVEAALRDDSALATPAPTTSAPATQVEDLNASPDQPASQETQRVKITTNLYYLFEDGTKLLGIIWWCLFWSISGYEIILAHTRRE